MAIALNDWDFAMTFEEIAAVTGLPNAKVQFIINNAVRKLWRNRIRELSGVKKSKKGYFTRHFSSHPDQSLRNERIVQMRKSGMLIKEIAEKEKLTKRTILRILKG